LYRTVLSAPVPMLLLYERGVTAKPWVSASPRLKSRASGPTTHFGGKVQQIGHTRSLEHHLVAPRRQLDGAGALPGAAELLTWNVYL
jgi:hypothetical protein